MEQYKLCYIDDSKGAYFTTQPLEEQWGDDWNDAPYEHNAGPPYYPCWHNDYDQRNNERNKVKPGELCKCDLCKKNWNLDTGEPKWKIKKLYFDSYDYQTPADMCINSPYSVEMINNGNIPWLSDKYNTKNPPIFAGTSIEDFIRAIKASGGKVYKEIE